MKISTLFFAAGFSRLLVWNAHHTNYNSIESRRDQDEHSPPVSRDSKVVDKISSEFGSFSGGDSNAVVTGHKKRNLDYANEPAPSTTTGAANTETTIINPPTGKMAHGNVFISLALAKQQPGEMGMTQPTPRQLQSALTGGQITTTTGSTATATLIITSRQTLDGILAMRSQVWVGDRSRIISVTNWVR